MAEAQQEFITVVPSDKQVTDPSSFIDGKPYRERLVEVPGGGLKTIFDTEGTKFGNFVVIPEGAGNRSVFVIAEEAADFCAGRLREPSPLDQVA